MSVVKKHCAVLWFVVLTFSSLFSAPSFAESMFANADKLIASELAIINKKAPMEINEQIRFDKAYVHNKVVTYDFTLISLKKASDTAYAQYAADSEFVLNRKQQICAAEHFKWYFRYGYSVEYRYLDESQLPVVGVSVNKDSC